MKAAQRGRVDTPILLAITVAVTRLSGVTGWRTDSQV
jgi:hypothetical protein